LSGKIAPIKAMIEASMTRKSMALSYRRYKRKSTRKTMMSRIRVYKVLKTKLLISLSFRRKRLRNSPSRKFLLELLIDLT
jgi:hypothetical protein